ncbi:MAG: acyltransferase [Candidatus Saccharibacteria bacterium]
MGKKWISELDYLRGIAFLAVVAQQCIGMYVHNSHTTLNQQVGLGVAFNLVRFAVPVFIFISGIAMIYTYFPSTHYRPYIKKRGVDIMLPYFLWTVIYINYYSLISTGYPSSNIKDYLFKLITGTGGYHLWFMMLIVQFYLVFPLFLGLFRWLVRQTRLVWYITGFTIFYIAFIWVPYTYIPAHAAEISPHWLNLTLVKFKDRNFVYWIYYFLLGGVAALYIDSWRAWIKKVWKWAWLVWVPVLVWVSIANWNPAGTKGIVLGISSLLKPSMAIFTIANIILLYYAALKLADSQSWLARLLNAYGKYSVGAYFVHVLMIYLAQKVLRLFWPSYGEYPVIIVFVIFVFCAITSLAFSIAMSRMPGGSYLVGKVKANTPNPILAESLESSVSS